MLPPSLTATGEPLPLPVERTSLTVSIVTRAATTDRRPLLEGDRCHRPLRQAQYRYPVAER